MGPTKRLHERWDAASYCSSVARNGLVEFHGVAFHGVALHGVALHGVALLVVAMLGVALLTPACGRPLGAWFGPEGEDPDPSATAPIWPLWGGGPGRTGQSPNVGPRQGDLVAITLVPPVVEDEPEISHVIPGTIDARGQVYALARDADSSGWLFGIDVDLRPYWAYRPPYGSVSGLPVMTADGSLVVECRDERLHGPMSEWYVPLVLGVIPPQGEAWTYYPESDSLCSQFFVTSQPIAASDGTLLISMRSGYVENRLHALWPDGSSRWEWSRTAGWRSSTAIGPDGTLYLAVSEASNTRIFALGPQGQTLWSTPAPSYSYFGLGLLDYIAVDAEGRLFAAGKGQLYHFSSTGHVIWAAQTPEPTVTAGIAVAPDGTLYLGTQSAPSGEEPPTGWLHAIDWTGATLWSQSFDTVPCGIPVVDANGSIYVVGRSSETGHRSEIMSLSGDGRVRFRKSFQDDLMPCGEGDDAWYVSSPMLDARGRLWFGSHSNRLMVVKR